MALPLLLQSWWESPRRQSWGLRSFSSISTIFLIIPSTAPSACLQMIASCTDLSKTDSIAKWETQWLMEFNVDKCFIVQAGRGRRGSPCKYILHGQELDQSDSAKYLGVTLTSDLKWNMHVKNVTQKANDTLGLIRRNLRIASKTIKTRAYQALVRPHLEYASTVWDPHTQINTQRLRWCSGVQPDMYATAGTTSVVSVKCLGSWTEGALPVAVGTHDCA